MTHRFAHPRRGITLVEVLATMVIVAIVLPVALRGIALTVTLAGLTRQRGEATALAESKLSELQVTGDWQNGMLSGDFGDAWPAYRWEAVVEPWDEEALQQLHIAVTWTTRGAQREVVLSTLVTPTSTSTSTVGATQ